MNSQNQWWSLWVFKVTQLDVKSIETIKTNCARFGRKAFGSASQMHIRVDPISMHYTIRIMTEGQPVTDPTYVKWMTSQWKRFFQSGGASLNRCEARLLAGSPQDGRPASQLVMIPTIPL